MDDNPLLSLRDGSERHESVHLTQLNAEFDHSVPKDDSPEAVRYRIWIMIRAVIGELIATTVFLFSVMASSANLAISGGNINIPLQNAIASGMAAVGMIYSFAEISGAHFNPAVTFATWIAGKVSNRKAFFFIIAQILGSIIASLMVLSVFPTGTINLVILKPSPTTSIGSAFLMEVYLTFILVFVIFTTAFELIPAKAQYSKMKAHDKGLTLYSVSPQSKAGFAPLAIGFCVCFLSMIGGSTSGGAFNPARAFGPAVCSRDFAHHWIYWIGDFVGAALAVILRQSYWYFFGGIKLEKSSAPSQSSVPMVSNIPSNV